ncbi:MAG: polysaccharide biosynthesis protein [Clostridiales bacterium]|nr:polysaccharide biosynthesis protein [Clostridiales bacterium]
MKKRGESFISGALILSLGGLFAKILGALYRIPLTNIIGSYGMGLYQLVFPPYILFLTVAQFGVPVALSKLIAENNQLGNVEKSHKIFRGAFLFLAALGALCSVLMASLSRVIALSQGNAETATAFLIVAPALLFVPVTNALKAYFQGNMNMVPSGVTTVIEQIVKLAVGLACAIHFMPDVHKAVMGAVFAITVSEFGSLLIMSVVYLIHRSKNKVGKISVSWADAKGIAPSVLALAIPVALGGFAMQMSQVIDSVMVVNLLTVPNATEMYGLWTGPVNSMLGLPIALSSGVAVSALPSITKAMYSGSDEGLQKSFNSAMKLTLVIALPCAFGMIALSRPILQLLYGSLPQEEIYVASVLLSLSGLSIVFLAIMQTCVSVCQAVGKPYATVIIVSLSIVVKAAVNLALLPNSQINIYGAAISETLCYLFATVCVIIYLRRKVKLRIDANACVLKPLAAGLLMTLFITVALTLLNNFFVGTLGTLALIAIAGGIYFGALWALKVFDRSELTFLPVKRKQE